MVYENTLPQVNKELYPLVEPFATGRLKVSDIHELYYEQAGNPNGKPAIVFHGGPGGGCAAWYRQFFNPEVYRVVLFDQRGSGRSTPFAELRENDTWSLVADVERIRQHLGIEKWHVVFGGSWGSTLALAYAQSHTDRVGSLILRGIFTLRESELKFFYQEGTSWLYPDAWEKYLEPIPVEERGDLMKAYHRRLTGDNEEEKLRCARAWSTWEMSTARLIVDPENVKKGDEDKFALAFARIENHFFVNKGFMEDGQLIRDAKAKIGHIPTFIVQGRYDVVCPAKTAWDLYKELKDGPLEFVMVQDSGHSMKESGIASALVDACDRYATKEL